MRRAPRYSRSDPTGEPVRAGASSPGQPSEAPASATEPAETRTPPGGLRAVLRRHERPLLVIGGGAIALLVILAIGTLSPAPPALTQRDIDMAVLHTLENQPRSPSVESMAYQIIGPSVVRVQRVGADEEGWLDPHSGLDRDPGEEDVGDEEGHDPDETPPDPISGLGTGVVVVEDGTILTNLHVVMGVDRLQVVFADGTESPARIVSIRPEMDLAVIQAEILPDDLMPATLRSTRELRMGDRVIAVGFPFGIGPSLTSGVVSGMRREYRTPEGERVLSNLIQFDAAANPGNSGGPLVTEDGHVVGIVTAILNPNNQRVFVGIGFAVPIEEAMEAVGSSPF